MPLLLQLMCRAHLAALVHLCPLCRQGSPTTSASKTAVMQAAAAGMLVHSKVANGGSKRSSNEAQHACAPPSTNKRARSLGSPATDPQRQNAGRSLATDGRRDKEKNRRAQQRFRERQKELVVSLKEEVDQMQQKVGAVGKGTAIRSFPSNMLMHGAACGILLSAMA